MVKSIIHISGPPGSGKTTLGIKLKKFYRSNVLVIDLDDLFREYNNTGKKFNPKKYQKYINETIKNCNKNIIFVGLNSEHITNNFYDLSPDYKFYIDLPVNENLQRHFTIEIDECLKWLQSKDKKILFEQLQSDEEQVIKDLTNALARTLTISKQKTYILSFDEHYKKENYEFLEVGKIYKKILKLI